MSAGRENAWFFTAANKVCPDLASLPLYVCKVNADGSETRIPHHPFLDLLETPSPGMSGELLRRQIAYDWKTEGNAYVLELTGPPSMPVVGLLRLHPVRTRIVPDNAGNATAYKYNPDGGAVYYSPDVVHHLRGISTQEDVSGVYGQGSSRRSTSSSGRTRRPLRRRRRPRRRAGPTSS
jgi:phage portal protein BeeE